MRPKELFHYASHPVTLEPRSYTNGEGFMRDDFGMKPWGLWISVEDYEDDTTWKSWCESESFRLRCLTHRHKIILKESANILVLSSHEQIIEFSKQYPHNDPADYERFITRNRELPYVYMVKWKEVKAKYDGIIIAPYIWEARFCTCATWYYPWDCASGCIWNLECIESFELFEIIPDKSLDKNKEEESDWDLPREAFDQRA
jgi:hypothetical protein